MRKCVRLGRTSRREEFDVTRESRPSRASMSPLRFLRSLQARWRPTGSQYLETPRLPGLMSLRYRVTFIVYVGCNAPEPGV